MVSTHENTQVNRHVEDFICFYLEAGKGVHISEEVREHPVF